MRRFLDWFTDKEGERLYAELCAAVDKYNASRQEWLTALAAESALGRE